MHAPRTPVTSAAATTAADPTDAIHDPARVAAVQRTMLLDAPPSETFDRLTELASFVLDVPIALCALLDDRRYFFTSSRGMPEPYCSTREVPAEAGFCKYALQARVPLVLADAAADPRFSSFPVVQQMGIRGYVGVPLITSDGFALGTFCAMDRKPRQWSPEQIRAVQGLAAAAVSEIERSTALHAAEAARVAAHAAQDELTRRGAIAEALVETAAILAGSRNVEQACQVIVDSIRSLLRTDAALLCTAEGNALRALAVAGDTGPSLRPGVLFPEGYGPPSLASRHRCVVTTLDVLDDPDVPLTPELRDTIAAAPFRAVMSVPLVVEGTLVGTLCVMDRPGRVFGPDDRRLAQGFAHQAALALQNARLLHETEERRREAERNSRAKDEFLAMLAHELRNPLAAVRSAVDVILRRSTNPLVLEAATTAERQLSHQVRLLDDLLDVARVTTGTISLHRGRFTLGSAVGDAVQAVRDRIQEHRQVLTVDVPSNVEVDADRTRLVQVLANLLSNATKYTRDGGTIRLTGAVDGGTVVLSVGDDGIGIDPEMLPRVFDPFVQHDRSLARSSGGLGIGLTLVQRIVELHGGTVEARSEGVGRGSEFVVRLPIAAAAQAGAAAEAVEAAARVQASRRVLVVEDNADARDMLRLALEIAGHEVHLAEDGRSGLAAAIEVRPHVALIDIGLPQINGYDLARQLRAQMGSSVLLCALTGYSQAADRRSGRDAGFDHYLVKPIDLDSLEEIIASAA